MALSLLFGRLHQRSSSGRRIGKAIFLALCVATCGICDAAVAGANTSVAAHAFAPHVSEASKRFDIPEDWIWRVMHAESRGKSRAVSPVGAMGLMQIMPGTWAMLTAQHSLGADPFDVRSNILAGTAYLRAMWNRYGDVSLMLAAYNAGPGRADAYAAGRRRLPAETINYISQIAPGLGTSGIASRAAVPRSSAPSYNDSAIFVAQSQSHTDANIAASEAAELRAERVAGTTVQASDVPRSTLFVPVSVKQAQ